MLASDLKRTHGQLSLLHRCVAVSIPVLKLLHIGYFDGILQTWLMKVIGWTVSHAWCACRSRQEISNAVGRMQEDVQCGSLSSADITSKALEDRLHTAVSGSL